MSCCFCSSKCFSARSCILFSPPPLPLTSLFCHSELWPHAPVQFFTGGLCFYLLFLRAIMTIRQPHEIFSSTQAAAFAGFTETPIIVGVQTCLSCLVDVQKTIRGAVAQLSRMCYLALSSKCVFKKGNIPAYLFLFYVRYWNLDVIVWARVQLPSACVRACALAVVIVPVIFQWLRLRLLCRSILENIFAIPPPISTCGGNWTDPLLERTMWKGPLLLTHLCNGSRAVIFPLTRTF